MEDGIGVIRVSGHSKRRDDPSTSPLRQEKLILATAEQRNINIVDIVVDLKISARKIAPWHRPKLGQWLPDLTDERNPVGGQPDAYKHLVFWKLDRVVRSVSDFSRISSWALEHGKNLLSADGRIDLSTPMGRAMAQITAVFAELEAEIIKERVAEGRAEVLSQGRWHGGRYPFGYLPEKGDGGWWLRPNEDTVPILEELIERILGNEPMNAVALDFDTRGIPTPKGGQRWVDVSIGKILRSRNLLGEFRYEEEIDGEKIPRIVQRADPLITEAQWIAIQQKLGTTTRQRTGASMLLNVAHCSACRSPLYHRAVSKTTSYRYYGCGGQWGKSKNGCTAKSLRAEPLEQAVGKVLLDAIGHLEVFEQKYSAPSAAPGELEAAEKKLADLIAQSAGQTEGVKRALAPHLEQAQSTVDELMARPAVDGGMYWVGTGETYEQLWLRSSDQERRELLLKSGIRVEATRAIPSLEGIPVMTLARPDREDEALFLFKDSDVALTMFIPNDITQNATGMTQELGRRESALTLT